MKSRSDWVWLILAVGIVVCGAAARFVQLGDPSLHIDESYHVEAALGINAGNGPVFPSGIAYTRCELLSEAVALSFRVFGVSEFSARLPGVIFGIVVIILTGLISRAVIGRGAALIAMAMVAASPLMIDTARAARMYSLLQLVFLLLWISYGWIWERRQSGKRIKVIGTIWLVVLLGVAVHVHKLALTFLPAVFLYWLLMAIRRRRGQNVVFVVVTLAGALIVGGLGLVDTADLMEDVNYVPGWAASWRYMYEYYLKMWSQNWPWLWYVFPFAAAWLVYRYRRWGVMALCAWGVPFGIHSVIFDWKVPRYVSHLFPLAAIIVAPLLAQGVYWIWQRCRDTQNLTVRRFGTATVSAGLIVATVLMGLPALAEWREVIKSSDRPRWRDAYQFVKQEAGQEGLIVTTFPLAAQFYLERPADYILYKYAAGGETSDLPHNAEGLLIDKLYTGLPILASARQFRSHLKKPYWVMAERSRFYEKTAVHPELREYIEENCEQMRHESVVVFACKPGV